MGRLKASKSHHIFFSAIQKNGVKKQKIPEKKVTPHYVKTKHYKVPFKNPKIPNRYSQKVHIILKSLAKYVTCKTVSDTYKARNQKKYPCQCKRGEIYKLPLLHIM